MRLRANISAKLVQKWPLYEYKNVVLHEINREKSEVANNHIHLLYPRIDEIDTSNYLRNNLFEFTIRRFYYISIFPGNLYNFISNFDSKGIWLSLFVWEPFYSEFSVISFLFQYFQHVLFMGNWDLHLYISSSLSHMALLSLTV